MKQIEVVAAIIRKGDKIFATQRGYGDWKDWWERRNWCSLISEALHLNEHEAARWLSIEEINSVKWLPADRIVVNTIKKEYE